MVDDTHPDTRPDVHLATRRSVLLLLGAGALAPAAVTLLPGGVGAASPPAVVDGLRFEVLGAARRALADHGHRIGAHSAAASWPDVVRVQLRLHNVAGSSLLVSPGQFRLRVGRDLSVMPTGWLHGPAALAAGATRTGWIDYRAPASAGLLRLDFTAAGRRDPVTVALTHLSAGQS